MISWNNNKCKPTQLTLFPLKSPPKTRRKKIKRTKKLKNGRRKPKIKRLVRRKNESNPWLTSKQILSHPFAMNITIFNLSTV